MAAKMSSACDGRRGRRPSESRPLEQLGGPLVGPLRLMAMVVLIGALLTPLALAAAPPDESRTMTTMPTTPVVEALEAAADPTTTTTTTTTTATTTAPSTTTKIPPVNFSRVDELFDEALEESEVANRWRKMDRTLIEGVRGVLKVVVPHIVAMASDAKVSGNCRGAILKWILGLRNMRTWAVKMLDAIGKPSAGILEGSLTLFGNYKQCLDVRAPDEDEIELADEFREYFRGQYCVLQLKPALPGRPHFYSLNSTIQSLLRSSYKYYERNVYDELAELAMAFHFVSIRADLCLPSRCSRDDIQRVADFSEYLARLEPVLRVPHPLLPPPNHHPLEH